MADSKATVTITRTDIYNAYNPDTKRYDRQAEEVVTISIETDKEHIADAYVKAKHGFQEGGKAFSASLKGSSKNDW